jgi:hypothetical protein
MLGSCQYAGDWLLLKNLHLVVAWLPLLEKEVHSLPCDSLHLGFRLFLTTEAHPRFPPTLLEGALKVREVESHCCAWRLCCAAAGSVLLCFALLLKPLIKHL